MSDDGVFSVYSFIINKYMCPNIRLMGPHIWSINTKPSIKFADVWDLVLVQWFTNIYTYIETTCFVFLVFFIQFEIIYGTLADYYLLTCALCILSLFCYSLDLGIRLSINTSNYPHSEYAQPIVSSSFIFNLCLFKWCSFLAPCTMAAKN